VDSWQRERTFEALGSLILGMAPKSENMSASTG